jgi:excisionase family DNA binding protein
MSSRDETPNTKRNGNEAQREGVPQEGRPPEEAPGPSAATAAGGGNDAPPLLPLGGRRPPSEPPAGGGDRLLSVKELAHKLDVSIPWVYQRVASGEIPVIRVGGLVRFHWPAIWAWLGCDSPPPNGVLPSNPRRRR